MICDYRARTIAGVITLIEHDNPAAHEAAVDSLREIEARLKASGWAG
jgi:hypothetical protein